MSVAQVTVLNGPLAGSVVQVGEKLTLGRRPENTLRLRDDQVSRYHAVIERRGERWVVEDLGSRTGTEVDGKPIEGSTILEDGSQLVIGQTILRFDAHQEVDRRDPVTEPRTPIHDSPPRRGSYSNSPRESSRVTLVPVDQGPFCESLAKKNAAELRRVGEHLQTLLTANSIISSELDIEKLFEKILDQICNALPAHRAVIMTKAAPSAPLTVRASRIAGGGTIDRTVVSQTIVNRAFNDRIGVLTLDAGLDERFDARQSIVDMNIRSAICVPMLHHEAVLGVIYLDTVGITEAFKEDDLRLLTGIAGPAGGAVKNALLVARLRATAADTILRLAVAAEYRDDDTGFHIHRMSDYGEAIARAMGKEDEFCQTLKLASPMHDVGKIGIPDSILKKPGKLTRDEFEEMKQHTVKGGAILAHSDSDLLKMAEQIAMTHHEKFDGSGYPRGLVGRAIPVEGRIVAVADVFDALTSARCYKPAFGLEEAFSILAEGRGAHFDPEIIDCFMAIRPRILSIRDQYIALEASGASTPSPLDRPLPPLQ